MSLPAARSAAQVEENAADLADALGFTPEERAGLGLERVPGLRAWLAGLTVRRQRRRRESGIS